MGICGCQMVGYLCAQSQWAMACQWNESSSSIATDFGSMVCRKEKAQS